MSFEWGDFGDKHLDSILHSDARINIWDGAVRSGKTIASIVRWLEYTKSGPPGDLLMCGKTERTLKRNILDVIEDMVGPRYYRHNQGTGEVTIFGRRCYIVGANDERSEGKIRGVTLAGAYCDELTLWPESFFKMLLSRLSVAGAQLFGTTNPDGPAHWLNVQYLKRIAELDMKRWSFILDDNPNLDPKYIANLKSEYTGMWYDRYILGLWRIAEGAIYDMFDERINVVPDASIAQGLRINPPERFILVDYGTTNPCVFLDVVDDGTTWWVIDEYRWDSQDPKVLRQKTDKEYAADMENFIGSVPYDRIVIDPSAASFRVELVQRGFLVTEADNDVLDGIRKTSTLLKRGLIKISDRCSGLIEEMQGYRWDEKAAQRGEEKPIKVADHGPDALRYGVNTLWANWRLAE